MANAGVDASNADGKIVLLPKDSFAAAEIVPLISAAFGRRISASSSPITASCAASASSSPWVMQASRASVITAARRISSGGIKTLPHRYRRWSRNSSGPEMGEGREQQPLAVIEDAPVEFDRKSGSRTELHIDIEDDVYRPLLTTCNVV